MAIEAKCAGCGRALSAKDELAGKRVKCPKCGATVQVPGVGARADRPGSPPARTSAATASQKDETGSTPAPGGEAPWFLQTRDGQQFGPVEKRQLDAWVAEGRVDAGCQVLQQGWPQWKWAAQVYPRLEGAQPSPGPTPAGPSASQTGSPPDPIVVGADTGMSVSAPGTSGPQVNPYASPQQVQLDYGASKGYSGGGGEISPTLRRAFSETRPWVITLAVVGFLWGGLFLLLLLFSLIRMLSFSPPAEFLLFMLLAIVIHVLILVASFFALKYGMELGILARRSEIRDLGEAARAQRAAWQFVCLTALAIVGTFLFLLLLGATTPMPFSRF